MKKLFAIVLTLSIALIFGCSSTEEKEKAAKKEVRKFQLDYILQNAKTPEVPSWINDPQAWARQFDKKDAKKFRYFVSTSEVIKNRRLCEKSADAQATAKIAGEITQFIKNSYTQAVQGDADEEVEQYMEDALAQEIQSFIIGANVYRTYWEKRWYKEGLGADEDKRGHVCSALVKIDSNTLKKAIKNAKKKIFANSSNPESKKKAEDALKDAEEKFDKL